VLTDEMNENVALGVRGSLGGRGMNPAP